MLYRKTIDEIPLALDDESGSVLVAVDFEIAYDVTTVKKFLGMGSLHQVEVHHIEPVSITFGKFTLFCRNKDGGYDTDLDKALGHYMDELEVDATTGDLMMTLIERGE
jgi:hypothetical protein